MTVNREEASALLSGDYPMQNDALNYTMRGTATEAVLWSKAEELAQSVVALHDENARLVSRIRSLESSFLSDGTSL